jgi:hypothetical protein
MPPSDLCFALHKNDQVSGLAEGYQLYRGITQ